LASRYGAPDRNRRKKGDRSSSREGNKSSPNARHGRLESHEEHHQNSSSRVVSFKKEEISSYRSINKRIEELEHEIRQEFITNP
jgi:hypothetical protein